MPCVEQITGLWLAGGLSQDGVIQSCVAWPLLLAQVWSRFWWMREFHTHTLTCTCTRCALPLEVLMGHQSTGKTLPNSVTLTLFKTTCESDYYVMWLYCKLWVPEPSFIRMNVAGTARTLKLDYNHRVCATSHWDLLFYIFRKHFAAVCFTLHSFLHVHLQIPSRPWP